MNKVLKSTLGVVASIATIATTVAPAANVMAWGDSGKGRDVYTIAQINDNTLNGGKGILGDKIVFNSIADPNYKSQESDVIMPLSDERNFVGARDASTGNHGKANVWDGNTVTVKEGNTYIVRLYVHNNNRQGTAATAENVKVSFQLPQVISKSPRINGYIDAPDTAIESYWDYVDFKSADGRAFYLDYIEGSALIESNHYGKHDANGDGVNDGRKVSDNIVTNAGVKVSYENEEDGKVPGCYGYASYYTIEVKPVFENTSIEKTVRMAGTKNEFTESVDAKVGDKVEFQIHYTNLNASTVNDVMIRDSLPKNLRYVAGSAKLYNDNTKANEPTQWQAYKDLTSEAVNIGHYAVNAGGYIRFTAEVVDETLECNKNNRLINWAKASANGFAVQDSAQVYVEKICDPTKPVDPGTPETIPSTGPAAIAGSIIGAGSIITAAGYYIASRKQLR